MSRLLRSSWAVFLIFPLLANLLSTPVARADGQSADQRSGQDDGGMLSIYDIGAPSTPVSGKPAGQYDYLVLSLSYLPQACRNGGKEACGRPTDFAVHGLWPQNADHTYPVGCSSLPPPSATQGKLTNLLAQPSGFKKLWSGTGSCFTGSSNAPGLYADAIAAAAQKIAVPSGLGGRNMTMDEIRQAFIKVNPGLTRHQITLRCASGNWLQEVRVCLSRDGQAFHDCDSLPDLGCHPEDVVSMYEN